MTINSQIHERLQGVTVPAKAPESADWPSGSTEPLGQLLDDIQSYYERYVVFSMPQQARALALWTLYTHCNPMDQPYSECPYVLITSAEPMSGKSTVLELAACVVHNPLDAQDVTPALLGRTVAGRTLLLDEIDGLYNGHDDSDSKAGDMRTILNAGFKKNGTYKRLVKAKGGDYDDRTWSVFGPKMLAGIGRKVPDTVQGRSIRIRMSRKTSDAPAQKARSRTVAADAGPLKARMAIAAAQLGELPYVEDLARELGSRDLDLWEPLFAIARLAGPEWETAAEDAAIVLSKSEPVMSLGMRLLRDIRSVFNDKLNPGFLATKDLIGTVAETGYGLRLDASGLCAIEDAPWATSTRGRPITAHALAALLGEYDIKSFREVINRHDYSPTGYARRDFDKSWDVYLEPLETPDESGQTTIFPVTLVATDGAAADTADSADSFQLGIEAGPVH